MVHVMHFCECPIHCSALESGKEARIVQIYLISAFDSVNHQGILYKLCSVGIRGTVLSILTDSIKLITSR